MRNLLFFLLIICCASVACRRLPDVQGKGAAFLQGVWNEDIVIDTGTVLNYTQHKFKFTCDSFYVDLTTHSKINYYEESCFNKGVWKEYAKGTYQFKSDTVFLVGTYTKANYKQKISGCYQIGQYIKSFKVTMGDPSELRLESTETQRELRLLLKQKITCIPQAL